MNQRFTLDRKSFEQFLAAVSMLQQLRKQAAYKRAMADPNQPLMSLLQLQRAISSGSVDVETAMSAVVRLAVSVLGASSAGVWMFRNHEEFSCCARIGPVFDPDRLGTDILTYLATSQQPDADAFPISGALQKASHYPGYPNTVAIAPLRSNGNLVGALAVFSMDFEAFTPRDHNNLQFLAGLFEQAIQKAMRAGYREAVALERSSMLKMLESLVPRLKDLHRNLQTETSTPESALPQADETQPVPGVPPGVTNHPFDIAKTPTFSSQPASEDIYVPGVGVRAALGDTREFLGEEEPSFFSRALGQSKDMARQFAAKSSTLLSKIGTVLADPRTPVTRGDEQVPPQAASHSVPFTARISSKLLPIRASLASLAHRKVRIRLKLPHLHRPALPHCEFSLIRNKVVPSVKSVQSSLRKVGSRIGDLVTWEGIRARTFRRDLRQKRANALARLAEHRMRMRIVSRRRQTALSSSAGATGEALQRAGESLNEAAGYAGRSTLRALETVRNGVVGLPRPKVNRLMLQRSASAVVILAIMAVFAILQATGRSSFHRKPVRAVMAPAAAPTAVSPVSVAPASMAVETGPTSHLEITDSAVAEALHESTRYEIATLQRAAEYGDDEAAFQLGMAYETGYYVRQNCSKAAHWVKIAAEAGNPAAGYNLGLRYRNGDGVEIDESAAEHWLKMSSARKYSPAKLASALER